MLTSSEEYGLREILNDFSDSDLFSLADTVTKKLLNITNRSDAIQAIISCLEKPSDLLKRQKITKRILFSYLLKIKPFVSPQCTKAELVQVCLTEWDSIEQCKKSDYENNSNTTDVQRSDTNSLKIMGTQFAMWFFPIYNTLQDFGPEHFWTDCKLIGQLKTACDIKEVAVEGDAHVQVYLSPTTNAQWLELGKLKGVHTTAAK
ncbi:hypothetical protein CDAR_397691 [Caerostris darwini]|uniref:Uncharacterized protein n=1 Tax=Caerostris darwini TaxID=1538125 RepID=A0AAV4T7V2_9ARAC|nr:hypothetical protein CDAR_397691 [Caerostris darwini]